MFYNSVSQFICIFVLAVTLTDYSDSACNSGIDPEDTDHQSGKNNTESSTAERVPEANETSAEDVGALLVAGDCAMVTLVAGQTRIAVHRAVLAASSPVLAAMLQANALGPSSGQIAVPGVEGQGLQGLVAAFYSQRPPRPQQLSTALHLLEAADRYGVPELRVECERHAATLLSVETAAATAVLAISRSYPVLAEATVAFISEWRQEVQSTPGWVAATCQQRDQISQRLAQERSGRRQCSRRRATTPPVPRACPTAPSDDLSVSSLRKLPAEKKGKRLIEAAKWGDIDKLRALLAAGADVKLMDRGSGSPTDKKTALHWAAWEGNVKAVKVLLDAGVDVGIRSSLGYAPLNLAALRGRLDVVRLLLAECADPNTATTSYGWTPLHEAAHIGHVEVAKALLEAGADVGAKAQGRTPMDIAKQQKSHNVAKLLGCSHLWSE